MFRTRCSFLPPLSPTDNLARRPAGSFRRRIYLPSLIHTLPTSPSSPRVSSSSTANRCGSGARGVMS